MNMQTNSCPCCGSPLLRHARQSGVYWFCTSCWQEVPLLAVSQMPRPESIVVRSRPVQPVNS
ncbi:hypothetical protein [Chroococcidiopsis sp. CCMEE 29]|uniref:hypothetical protein n=1 Tax=Chroococcidiopsis sp. CCMEE 29 TaxID=155894 RepID=UPI00202203E0|nr:hypothetical protein [Chroococcidiopsis sp. CCMEE 29]